MTVASEDIRHPLRPDSLTWKYFGDLRTGMMGVDRRDQNMYPELVPVSRSIQSCSANPRSR